VRAEEIDEAARPEAGPEPLAGLGVDALPASAADRRVAA
jgi:hypothetical protein